MTEWRDYLSKRFGYHFSNSLELAFRAFGSVLVWIMICAELCFGCFVLLYCLTQLTLLPLLLFIPLFIFAFFTVFAGFLLDVF